jgi:DNA repair exonuclease SbcCD ATPase subunit
MAEDPNSPLNQALAGLGTTINTITDKVEAGKTRVREYKAQIIAKLREVVEQLNSLKSNNNLKALPQLRKQLQDSQAALQQKTDELDQTKGQLNEANQNLQQLQQNLDQINRQIEEKNQQITDLTNSGNQKDKAIQELNAQVRELDKQKEEAEKNLVSAQQQIDSIIQKIGQLNTALVNQIQLIDTIANELGDLDNGDVAEQFRTVTDNIKAIVDMLNSAGQGGAEEAAVQQQLYDVEQNFNKLVELHSQVDKGQYQRFVRGLDGQIQNQIAQVINLVDRNDPQAIAALKQILEQNKLNVPTMMNGGKSRRHKKRGGRKTMKKKHRKTRKLAKKNYKGGYVYSASKDLDKASSVISASSSSKSSSKSSSGKRHKRSSSKR